jgi:hypothetical protein
MPHFPVNDYMLTIVSALAALEDAGEVGSPPTTADEPAANAEAKLSE